MRKMLMMCVLAGVVGLFGCGGDSVSDVGSDGLTWYCGTEKKPRSVKATLKDGTLTISGKGAMRYYWEPSGCIREDADYAKVMKEWRVGSWAPWRFAVEYNHSISITSVVIEKGVTYIGDLAFAELPELKSITIHEGVKTIGEEAFKGCTGLTSVTLPNSVKTIGNTSFNDCANLKSLIFAADNPRYSFEDGIIFNKNKTILRRYLIGGQRDAYTIPNSVKTIGYGAFVGRDDLTSITLHDNVKAIGDSAFAYCYGLMSFTIPNSVKTIGREAFKNCTRLTSIVIPDGVKTIEDETFESCIRLMSVTIPAGVTYIGSEAFKSCYGLKSITIPNGVTKIEHRTFEECYGLTSVAIPDRVKIIEVEAFTKCTSLTSITIPNRVKTIGYAAFRACRNLTSIIVQNPAPPEFEIIIYVFKDGTSYSDSKAFDGIDSSACLYVPKKSIAAYRAADTWKDFKCIKAIASAPK